MNGVDNGREDTGECVWYCRRMNDNSVEILERVVT